MTTADDGTGDGTALWPTRYLTGGELVVPRSPRPRPATSWRRLRDAAVGLDWLDAVGRWWLRLPGEQRLVLGVVLFLLTAGAALVLPLAGVAVHRERTTRVRAPGGEPLSPGSLAAWDTTEARVAAAAGRAWAETVREPAWHSPFLATSRAAFDGQAEVDRIVDLALRIRSARLSLGLRPAGPAAEYWDRQSAALEASARRLGARADALIRYRDQAALLSAELRQLADLERLERSAVEIDGLTVETAYAPGAPDGGLGTVAEEVAAVRGTVAELIELMTRTRAPLAEPPQGLRASG